MAHGLTASVKRSAERSTLELPFYIPEKSWFTIAEVAKLFGMGETFVEDLFDKTDHDGKGPLFGYKHNAAGGARNTKRIPRESVVAYAAKSATADMDAIADEYIRSQQNFTEAALRKIAAAALARADKLSALRKSA